MLSLLVAASLAGAPIKVAAPGLSYVGIKPELGDVYAERFVTVLGETGAIKVTTAKDIAQVLGLERQKQLLGCSDASSACLAELAGGLGVDAVLGGSLAKTGSFITVTLRVVKANDGSQVASASTRLKDEDALQEWLEAEAPRLREQILQAFGVAAAVQAPAKWPRLLPGIAGIVAVAGGAICYGVAAGKASLLRGVIAGSMNSSPSDIMAAASDGRTFNGLGLGLLIGGALAIAVSVLWMVLAR